VASLANGDANCPNGGASVTDGNGTTAYACNGANGTGTTDLQAFQVNQDAFVLPGGGARVPLPGLSETLTSATDSVYVVNANVSAFAPAGPTGVSCQMAIDGALRSFPNASAWVSSGAPLGSLPLTAAFPLSAGTHTIQILCFADSSVSVEGTMTGFNAG
jgi:hypothetical protein